MRLIIYCLSLVMVVGCQFWTAKKKPVSTWDALDQAKGMKCERWPVSNEILRIEDIKIIKSEKPLFLEESTLRDGSRVIRLVPFGGTMEVVTDQAAKLNFGRDSLIIGGSEFRGKTYIGILPKNSDLKQNVIEIRSIPDNIVKYQSGKLKEALGVISSGELRGGDGGFWLLYGQTAQTNDDLVFGGDEDFEQGKVVFLKTDDKTAKLTAKTFPGLELANFPKILKGYGSQSILAISLKNAEGKKVSAPFMLQELFEDGRRSTEKNLEIQVVDTIESWTVEHVDNQILLAVVDGDTVVGRAKLKLASFLWKNDLLESNWAQEIAINDTHVSEPILLSHGTDVHLIFLHWVDEESTMAVYKITGNKLETPVIKGIFPNGAKIIDTFFNEKEGEFYALIRYRENSGWNFELCNLGEL